jgi:hypothetical protein
LRAIQENFEEGYVKVKKKKERKKERKKSGMEGEDLSFLRGANEISIKERHNKCQKSTPEKIKFQVFWWV